MSEQPTTEVEESVNGANEDPHQDPFAGNSVRITVSRRIDVGQLTDEISRRTKVDVQLALSTDDPEHIASEGRPAVLFVSPGNINERVVRDVISGHAPRPERRRPIAGAEPAPEAPSTISLTLTDEVKPLVKKLEDGETLKTSEASDLLRAILGISVKE